MSSSMRTLERVVETRMVLLEEERQRRAEDCARCRALDCDILFALLFTLMIACLLVLIMVFWLKGVLSYEESVPLSLVPALRAYAHVYSLIKLIDCDRLFDSSTPRGHFVFPELPQPPSPPISLDDDDDDDDDDGDQLKSEIRKAVAERNRIQNDMQCIYTFIAGGRQRVRVDFEHFQLAGTPDNCELEYVDIYSELEHAEDELLDARISLHRVIVLVFHSRSGQYGRAQMRVEGVYSFLPDDRYRIGHPVLGHPCSFIVDSSQKPKGTIVSPTYPGTYPSNFHCSYLLRGREGERIRILFRDFDIYFGGEHCPYDLMTIYDGPSTSSAIVRKICGLQPKLELFSVGSDLLLHFNTTNPSKADPRGYTIDYEFSTSFCSIQQLVGGEAGVTHIRGTECDLRVQSNRETVHFVHSPNYPALYPANTTCTYIIDGLQGDQNLEKAILTFTDFAVISDTSDNEEQKAQLRASNVEDVTCAYAYVGVSVTDANIKATMSSSDESAYDHTLCERIPAGEKLLGPYVSEGPRMVLQFGATAHTPTDGRTPLGFRASIEFKTDFGVPGEPMGGSNECLFLFNRKHGFFNSPRYPANYPSDTTCTYHIVAQPGEEILIHFEQFALHDTGAKDCADWLDIYDVFPNDTKTLKGRYCPGAFPGPSITSQGSHELRVVFASDATGTANGFKCLYEVRHAPPSDIPANEKQDARRCGRRIRADSGSTAGHITSPGYPIKYNKDVVCHWHIDAKPGYQVMVRFVRLEVEGEMVAAGVEMCQKAVIRVSNAPRLQYCGTDSSLVPPIVSHNASLKINFLTAPDKVNGLKGFNLSWTVVRLVEESEDCAWGEFLCTYSQMCIDSKLRCNGEPNCGANDESDESHCERTETGGDKTITTAVIVCSLLLLVLAVLFCILIKKKFAPGNSRRRHRQGAAGGPDGQDAVPRMRQPYRQQKPKHGSEVDRLASSRLARHDETGGALAPTSSSSQN